MPRHSAEAVYNGRPVIVTMGYDVPLQYWFMTVEPVDDDNPDASEDSGMIYTNLDDLAISENPNLAQSMDYYRSKLREMKITMGDHFFNTVAAECD
jgi:hypothetical protein